MNNLLRRASRKAAGHRESVGRLYRAVAETPKRRRKELSEESRRVAGLFLCADIPKRRTLLDFRTGAFFVFVCGVGHRQ
jgi:hypothetical protein